MATPQFQVQGPVVTLLPSSPGQARFNALDPVTGNAIDLSSGYTVDGFRVNPLNAPNRAAGATALTSNMTPTFDTTGLTMKWTGAQATTMSGSLNTQQLEYVLTITNDSGSTISVIGEGQMQIDTANGIL